ncbi:MAG TPA: hypothetical protein PKC21_07870 [Oligoflexia bacterium]|nr:hypothetical protein [Oligoflexia bacterium]HMR25254.1 hypothetical protein [Oligoflexia bacterium]
MIKETLRELSHEERTTLINEKEQHHQSYYSECRKAIIEQIIFIVIYVGIYFLIRQLMLNSGDELAQGFFNNLLIQVVLIGFALMLPASDIIKAIQEYKRGINWSRHQWEPFLKVEKVKEIKLDVEAFRIISDRHEDVECFFLQSKSGQILALIDFRCMVYKEDVSENLKIVSGANDMILSVSWEGKKLKESIKKRKFLRSELKPEQFQIFDTDLKQLDKVLKENADSHKAIDIKDDRIERLLELGFFKYVDNQVDQELYDYFKDNNYELFDVVEREFFAEYEHIAEGGAFDLLKSIQPHLKINGVKLKKLRQVYEPEKHGYRIYIADKEYIMWTADEAKNSWEFAFTRIVELINSLLQEAGSKEKLFYWDEEVLLLLSQDIADYLTECQFFKKKDQPVQLV